MENSGAFTGSVLVNWELNELNARGSCSLLSWKIKAMNRKDKEAFHVLLADDCESDRLLIKMAMRHVARLRLSGEASDGDGVLNYFLGREHFSDRAAFPVPDLLLLDLKMPGRDGFAVLDWLKSRPYRDLTVVVLTDSMEPEHIKRALDLGADLYQVKPRTNDDRLNMLVALESHLVKICSPPQYSRLPLTARTA
jgi:CheY-like chemotaxis protein